MISYFWETGDQPSLSLNLLLEKMDRELAVLYFLFLGELLESRQKK